MNGRSILVVEDDAAIRQGMVDALQFHGYATAFAGDGKKGLELVLEWPCDLVLLDLVLPGIEGLEILQRIRDQRATLPVIILTARGGEDDRVRGLQLGADDYVVKPFSVKELIARVDAVLRRSPERARPLKEIRLPCGSVSFDRLEVRYTDGTRAELSQREAELLQYLASNAARAISREELLRRVWKIDPRGLDTRTIDMQVARLREKLRDDAAAPSVLMTVRGKGYMLAGPPPGGGKR